MKIAVLGLGSAGTRHADELLRLGHEVVGWDPDRPESPRGVSRVGSLKEALRDSAAAIVASPSAHHADQACAALDAGCAVLVEKPLATNEKDASRTVAKAAETQHVCGIAMNLRFYRPILELRRLLQEGTLGDVRYARASFGYDLRRWRPESDYRQSYSARRELGGGIVLDAIHELDYLLWLLGPVETVSAEADHVSDLEIDVEDIAIGTLRFESGALASVDVNFIEPAYRRTCLLVGSRAVARWSWSDATITVAAEGQADQVLDVGSDLADAYTAQLEDFLEAVKGKGEPRATAADGLQAVRLAEAVKRSAASGRRVAVGRAPRSRNAPPGA